MTHNVEARFELPSSWVWAKVADLAAAEPRAITDGPFGSNLKSSHYTDEGPRVIRLQNVGEGEFIAADAHIADEHFEALRDHEARGGDIVLGSLGEELPRACLVPAWLGPAIVKADCPRFRPHPSLNAAYLMLALNSPPVRAQAAQVVHGVGRQRLKLAELKKLKLPLPPRAEQDRIVERVQGMFSEMTSGVRYVERALAALPAHRSALRTAACTGRLFGDTPEGLPPGWRWVTLGETAANEPRSLTDGPFGSNLRKTITPTPARASSDSKTSAMVDSSITSPTSRRNTSRAFAARGCGRRRCDRCARGTTAARVHGPRLRGSCHRQG